jgi:hypothetical protein
MDPGDEEARACDHASIATSDGQQIADGSAEHSELAEKTGTRREFPLPVLGQDLVE